MSFNSLLICSMLMFGFGSISAAANEMSNEAKRAMGLAPLQNAVEVPFGTKQLPPELKKELGIVTLPENVREVGAWSKISGSGQGCDVVISYHSSTSRYFKSLRCPNSINRDAEEVVKYSTGGLVAYRKAKPVSQFGDFYVVHKDGTLSIYDKAGLIDTYPKALPKQSKNKEMKRH